MKVMRHELQPAEFHVRKINGAIRNALRHVRLGRARHLAGQSREFAPQSAMIAGILLGPPAINTASS